MLRYIFSQREIHRIFTALWFKSWIKRLFHLYGLVRIEFRKSLLRFRGAKVSDLSYVGDSRLKGNVSNLVLKDFCSVGDSVYMAMHGKITIGKSAVVNDGVRLLTASHNLQDSKWSLLKGDIVIEDYAWVAMGVTVLPGIVIGKGAVVGAGAVVTKNVAPYSVVGGNPAKIIGSRTNNLVYKPALLCAPFEAWVGSK